MNPLTDKIRAESTSTGPAGNRRSAIFRVLPVRFLLLALGAIALLGAIGCYNNNTGETVISGDIHFKLPAFPETGSNKIQVFTEMHYQPSYRAQEGPRLMPPEGSVPITGAEVLYTSVEEYKSLPNPGGDANVGAGLFAINCMVCHGERMDGQGMVMIVPKETPDMAPADLMGEITTDRPDGELYGIISFGGSTAFPLTSGRAHQPGHRPRPLRRLRHLPHARIPQAAHAGRAVGSGGLS